eukprot:SAG31_NODE_8062_length_1530_cov_1.897275_2_plen_114_part_00
MEASQESAKLALDLGGVKEEMFKVLHYSGKDKNFVNLKLKVGSMGVQLLHKDGVPLGETHLPCAAAAARFLHGLFQKNRCAGQSRGSTFRSGGGSLRRRFQGRGISFSRRVFV